MRLGASMGKRRRRKFTGEFKKEAVRLFREGERSIGQVARLCLLFIHPRAPNLISLRSAGTMPA